MIDPEKYRDLFVSEAREHLAILEAGLVLLERDAAGADIDALFRAAHSIKGAAATLGHTAVADCAHALEDHLDAIRRAGPPAAHIAPLLIEAADAIDGAIESIAEGRKPRALHAITNRLRSAATDPTSAVPGAPTTIDPTGAAPATTTTPSRSPQSAPENVPGPGDHLEPSRGSDRAARETHVASPDPAAQEHLLQRWQTSDVPDRKWIVARVASSCVAPQARLRLIEQLIGGADAVIDAEPARSSWRTLAPRSAPIVHLLVSCAMDPETLGQRIKALPDLGESRVLRDEDIQQAVAAWMRTIGPTRSVSTSMRTAVDHGHERAAPEASTPSAPAAVLTSTLRVPTARLDRLVDLMGALRHTEASLDRALSEAMGGQRPFVLQETMHRLQLGLRELQADVLEVGTVPAALVLDRLPRMVRDLARELEKDVDLRIQGRDVTVDRSIIEAVADPLTHLVRNALDHGIEPKSARIEAQKPGRGRITVRVERRARGLTLEVADDGRGIDPDHILTRARAQGFVPRTRTERLSSDEVLRLLATPGFTTADKVTAVSGRGVGMDVVYRQIERIGGSLRLAYSSGEGTQITMRLPNTLALADTMACTAAGVELRIPVDGIVTSLSLSHLDLARGFLEPPARKDDGPGAPEGHDAAAAEPQVRANQPAARVERPDGGSATEAEGRAEAPPYATGKAGEPREAHAPTSAQALLWRDEDDDHAPVPILVLADVLGLTQAHRYPGTALSRAEGIRGLQDPRMARPHRSHDHPNMPWAQRSEAPHGRKAHAAPRPPHHEGSKPGRRRATTPPFGVVIQRHGVRLCLAVDAVGAVAETILKLAPRPELVPGARHMGAVTFTPEGDVALVLDVASILDRWIRRADAHASSPTGAR